MANTKENYAIWLNHKKVIERAYRCMLYSELKISGINAEVAPGQWEY